MVEKLTRLYGRDGVARVLIYGGRRAGGAFYHSGFITVRRDYLDFGTHRVACGWVVSGRYCGGATGVWYGNLRAAIKRARHEMRRAMWLREIEAREGAALLGIVE